MYKLRYAAYFRHNACYCHAEFGVTLYPLQAMMKVNSLLVVSGFLPPCLATKVAPAFIDTAGPLVVPQACAVSWPFQYLTTETNKSL